MENGEWRIKVETQGVSSMIFRKPQVFILNFQFSILNSQLNKKASDKDDI